MRFSISDAALQSTIVCEAIEKGFKREAPIWYSQNRQEKMKKRFSAKSLLKGTLLNVLKNGKKVREHIGWRKEVNILCNRWAAVSQEFDLPVVEDHGNPTGLWIADTIRLINKAMHMASQVSSIISTEVHSLFPHGMDAQKNYYIRKGCPGICQGL